MRMEISHFWQWALFKRSRCTTTMTNFRCRLLGVTCTVQHQEISYEAIKEILRRQSFGGKNVKTKKQFLEPFIEKETDVVTLLEKASDNHLVARFKQILPPSRSALNNQNTTKASHVADIIFGLTLIWRREFQEAVARTITSGPRKTSKNSSAHFSNCWIRAQRKDKEVHHYQWLMSTGNGNSV